MTAEFDNIENIKQAVDEGAGIAILPEPTLRREVRRGTLVQAPLALPTGEAPLVRPLSIVHRSNRRLSPAVHRVHRAARRRCAVGSPARAGHGRPPPDRDGPRRAATDPPSRRRAPTRRERTYERIRKTIAARIGPGALRSPVRARLLRGGVRGPHPGGALSRKLVDQALEIGINLLHRGACGCEPNTGDGAGLLMQVPDRFLRRETAALGFTLPPEGAVRRRHAVPAPARRRAAPGRGARSPASSTRRARPCWGGGDVPTDSSPLGGHGAAGRAGHPAGVHRSRPRPGATAPDAQPRFERKLYVIRRRIENAVDGLGLSAPDAFYAASLSSQTLVYKGMLIADQVTTMFPDLVDPDLESAIGLVHSRFSTNTFPSWPLSHPYRYIAHNGEINTLRGNINWMRAREALCESDLLGDDLKKLFPIIKESQSDTATFDNVLEFLAMTGRSLPHAVLMMIPEPWRKHESMSADRRAFYEYHSALMEPWDGPAIDRVHRRHGGRGGPRPQRAAPVPLLRHQGRPRGHGSEVGVLDVPAGERARQGTAAPGPDLPRRHRAGAHHRRRGDQVGARGRASLPGHWLDAQVVHLDDLPPAAGGGGGRRRAAAAAPARVRLHRGGPASYCSAPWPTQGVEPVGSMGTDTSLAVLSDRPRLLYDYFKQLFAQVTNPPLDAIREELVTDMSSTLGAERNIC